MQLRHNRATRRFSALWVASTAIKLAALAVFLALVLTVPGIPKP